MMKASVCVCLACMIHTLSYSKVSPGCSWSAKAQPFSPFATEQYEKCRLWKVGNIHQGFIMKYARQRTLPDHPLLIVCRKVNKKNVVQ